MKQAEQKPPTEQKLLKCRLYVDGQEHIIHAISDDAARRALSRKLKVPYSRVLRWPVRVVKTGD